MVGKVTQSTGAWYQVKSERQPIYTCKLRGKLRLNNWKLTNPVAVGDEVVFDLEKDKATGVITEILPRKNYIIRQSPRRKNYSQIIAANIDQVLLVATLAAPRTTLGMIDRFLVTAESWSIPATLLFNKVDRLDIMQQNELKAIRKLYEAIGYPTLAVSALKNKNIAPLIDLLANKTSLLSGPSGVGKSTLVNVIAPAINQKVRNLSRLHQKGTHTTTYAAMFEIAPHTFLMDTPGIKALVPHEIEKEKLSHYFPEMKSRLQACKFYNCTHTHEPACAVIKARKQGEIAESRYRSYEYMMKQ
ncbi:MAG: ribosome small subunit-dependent GTPase A [Cytophagales bacterium]|nr:ribosome small subunit-dependent GTPase A [Cytophagales bacterium]